MSKRPSDNPAASSSKKRKHLTLSIQQKVEILKKLQNGASAKHVSDTYNVGISTIYDIKKQKEKLLAFYANSDVPQMMSSRKTLHQSKTADIDKVLVEWIRQRRSENCPLDRAIIMAQARQYHEDLGLSSSCEYSTGWFNKFKKRNGLKLIKVCGERASADTEAAEDFVDELSEYIKEEGLSPEQIYNADETALFWRYIPRKTYTAASVGTDPPSGFKDSKERITVLACANAAGSHKCKLLVIGKSKNPRAFKGTKVFPVTYKSNTRAWITTELCIDWFKNHFVPEVRAHGRAIGLAPDCKILLLLDNCSAHPAAELLNIDNVIVKYMPPNCTSLIQPMDQGVLRSLKCKYKALFLKRILNACNNGGGVAAFQKEFSIKDAVWGAARAWEDIPSATLSNAWHNILPVRCFWMAMMKINRSSTAFESRKKNYSCKSFWISLKAFHQKFWMKKRSWNILMPTTMLLLF